LNTTSTHKCPKCDHSPCEVIEEKDYWHSHREIWLRCPACKHVFRLEIPWDKVKAGNLRIGRVGSPGRTLRDIVAP